MNLNSEILNQMPNIICCVNEKHEFMYINRQATLTFGFKEQQDIIGTKFTNIPCKAAEILSENWVKQNNDILKHKQSMKILDIGIYSDDKVLTLLTSKSVVINSENNQIGVTANCINLTSELMLALSNNLIKSDKKYHIKNDNNRSYTISNQFPSSSLTPREIECLFYLVRGKTARDIGKLLELSKRTVEFYLNNIKYKLNCNSKADLIELCVESNFMNIIPANILHKLNFSHSIVLCSDS